MANRRNLKVATLCRDNPFRNFYISGHGFAVPFRITEPILVRINPVGCHVLGHNLGHFLVQGHKYHWVSLGEIWVGSIDVDLSVLPKNTDMWCDARPVLCSVKEFGSYSLYK